MRLLVVIRKNWGGNRTENGARAQAILTSVLRTAQQQDKDAFQFLVDLLRSRKALLKGGSMYKRITLSHLLMAVLLIAQPPVRQSGEDIQCSGQDCGSVERGLHSFLNREVDGLRGNGRACADCHMPTNNFQLSPANAEARFQLLQFRLRFDPKADDPLFRPIDADDFRIHGANASDFTTLRRNGLSESPSRCRPV
jgi:hypothetical protein